MPQGPGDPYAFGFERQSDGSLHFRCSSDVGSWPWLSLAPQHPVVIQTQQFWASLCALQFEGGLEEGQWSALTWTRWTCGQLGVGRMARGRYERTRIEGKERMWHLAKMS